MPVLEQGRECERLRLAPVDAALLQRLAATLELPQQLGVHDEAVRDGEQLLVQRPQALLLDRRPDRSAGSGALDRLGGDRRRRLGLVDHLAQPVVRITQHLRDRLGHRRLLAGGDDAVRGQP